MAIPKRSWAVTARESEDFDACELLREITTILSSSSQNIVAIATSYENSSIEDGCWVQESGLGALIHAGRPTAPCQATSIHRSIL